MLGKRQPAPARSLENVLQDLEARKQLIRRQFDSSGPEFAGASQPELKQQRLRQALALLFGAPEAAETHFS